MAELTFKSAGVSHREIDLTGPTVVVPQGVPAAVIGTAQKGPAFVPVVVATYQDFVATFGPTDGKKFGPLAMNEWMKNARSGLYMRILGVGDGKKRLSADDGDTRAGGVKNAGYIVGNEQVQANGYVGDNPFTGGELAVVAATATVKVDDYRIIPTGRGAIISAGTNTAGGGIFMQSATRTGLAGNVITIKMLGSAGGGGAGFKDSTGAAFVDHTITFANTAKGVGNIPAPTNDYDCQIICNDGTTGGDASLAELAARIAHALGERSSTYSDSGCTDEGDAATTGFRFGAGWQLGPIGGIGSVFYATVVNTSGVQLELRGSNSADSGTYAADFGPYGGAIVSAVTDIAVNCPANAADTTGDQTITAGTAAAGSGAPAATVTVTAVDGTTKTVTANAANPGTDGFTVQSHGTPATGDINTATNLATAINAVTGFSATAGSTDTVTVTNGSDSGSDGNDATVAQVSAAGAFSLQGTTDAASANFTGGLDATKGPPGRAYVLGCFMSQSAGSDIFYDAGMRPGTSTAAEPAPTVGTQQMITSSLPIMRGIVMAPSGVILSLSSSWINNNAPAPDKEAKGSWATGGDAGYMVGSVNLQDARQEFVMFCNGLKETSSAKPNILTASFDPTAANYFPNIFNTDPTKIEEYGHYLHSWYNVYPDYAVVTGSGLTSNSSEARMVETSGYQTVEPVAFLMTSSVARNSGTATVPNFDNWRDRFSHAESPWVISQKFGGAANDLFKLHSLDAGSAGSRKFKISIENIQASTNENDPYGTFDLLVRRFGDNDRNVQALERFTKLSLDPGNDRYIARVIGDRNLFYDFEKKPGGQRLVAEGIYPNASRYIRVEMAKEVSRGEAPETSVPCGFRGPKHLVTSGSSIMNAVPLYADIADHSSELLIGNDVFHRVSVPPMPLRHTVAVGVSPKKRVDADLYWGQQFSVNDKRTEPNKNEKVDDTLHALSKWKPCMATNTQHWWVGDNAGAADVDGTVLDSDRFNNNIFTLERIQVKTQSNDTPDPKQWDSAAYRRDGTLDVDISSSRFLDPSKDFGTLSARRFLKFSFMMQGGFDGVNIFDKEKSSFSNVASSREMTDNLSIPSGQGGTNGPTISAYRKALDIIEEKSDCDIQLLVIPGQRHEGVTDYAIDTVEDRFDAMYIMDIQERDTTNNVVTSSLDQRISVTLTAEDFAGRNLDSSFAAAYFPDVVLTDPVTQTNVQVPPSVAILGAYGLNDAVAHPWFAPAGFTRGALKGILESQVKLNRDNLDSLYEVDINPITAFPHTPGVVAFGQKTVLASQSALDRVNVRRLLIEIRRRVRKLSRRVLFEPNREDTLAKFSQSVQPVLARIQQQQGLDKFKVVIDTTTTTQADVENNTIRGKIFLQPTRALEFISLDFVITNAGAEI